MLRIILQKKIIIKNRILPNDKFIDKYMNEISFTKTLTNFFNLS